MQVQPAAARMPGPCLGMGTCGNRTVVSSPILHAEFAPFLPARFPFGPVNGREDGQRYGDP
jgi:hypothetical protein